ncbi:MAG TPA: tetratricopeptide repeat protein [Acidobacteriaceae bacterium]|nr:tetratricopeptide repeat protein [Acidobacteriaceae bacterium]
MFCISALRVRVAFRRAMLPIGALLLLGSCAVGALAQAGDTDARVEQLYGAAKSAQSHGDRAGAIRNYEELVRIAPDVAPAYNNLGMLYLDERQYPKAAEVLKKGISLDPKMTSASALLGIALFEMGRYPESRTALETALRSNPQDDNAQLFLAKDLVQLKDMSAAAAVLRPLAQREPKNQEVWYLLGQAYMQLSEQALTRMSAIDPDSMLAHDVSGEVMEDMKNYQGALVEYKKAAAVAPADTGAHYHLGNLYWKLSQWDDALQQLNLVLKDDPWNCQAWAQVGNILVDQKAQPDQGLEDLNRALRQCPDLAQAHVDRGDALVKLGRNREAIQDLQTAERENPSDPMPHFFLSRAYKALGDSGQMKTEMEAYAKLQAAASAAVAARAAEVMKATQDVHP